MQTIRHYSVPLAEADMEKLKAKTEQKQSKEAITAAVEHFLACKDV